MSKQTICRTRIVSEIILTLQYFVVKNYAYIISLRSGVSVVLLLLSHSLFSSPSYNLLTAVVSAVEL